VEDGFLRHEIEDGVVAGEGGYHHLVLLLRRLDVNLPRRRLFRGFVHAQRRRHAHRRARQRHIGGAHRDEMVMDGATPADISFGERGQRQEHFKQRVGRTAARVQLAAPACPRARQLSDFGDVVALERGTGL